MTARKHVLNAENASRKTGSTNPNKEQRAAKTGGEKRAHKDGAERLRQAADKRVGRVSEKLADLLETKALAGNLNSLKVLVMLAERKRPRPEPVKKPRRPSLAQQLAAEPAWQEEREENRE
ncbi:MAG: hypothetical protein WAN35_12415 [Terracidiphilus sp.]|jgi:hypothetical protein